ncbi:MAG TPA: hypothetical protein VF139_11300 [Candidatus Polarisedimenticolaceae bacterium]
MKLHRLAPAACIAALFALPSAAAPTITVTETYDGPVEEASWRVASFDTILEFGGWPDAYLRVAGLDTFGPRIFAVPERASKFLGDYRAKGVSGLGVDVNLFGIDFGAEGRPVSLYLTNRMDPEDPFDDCDVVYVGAKNVPKPGTGWKSFDFRVPSESTTLPPGWVTVGECGGLSPDEAWNAVITDVEDASFYFGEPDYFYIFQVWNLGFDNPRIRMN